MFVFMFLLILNLPFRLQRFEKTNEMLTNCNALSQSRLKNVTEDYKKNCKLLLDMKKDLGRFFSEIHEKLLDENIQNKLIG